MPTRNGRDAKGRFYQWGGQRKYYYTDDTSRRKAKRRAILQGYAIKKSEARHGAGLYDSIKTAAHRTRQFISGRTPHSPALTRLIETHGDELIAQVGVGRVPIEGALKFFLNLLTLGGVQKAMKQLNYDKLWHLFANISTDKGTKFAIEKNEVIKVSNNLGGRFQQGGQYMTVWTRTSSDQRITLREFFERTIKSVGPDAFYTYSVFTHNCQHFIRSLLLANHMLTPQANAFILQDTASILKHVPSYSAGVASGLTDLAARFKILTGSGSTRSGSFRIDVPKTRLS